MKEMLLLQCLADTYFITAYTFLFLFLSTFFDIKKRIVPNWLTLPSIVIGLVFHLFFPSQGYLTSLFFAFLFSLSLYKVGAWAGGDVKFFLALFSLSPITDCVAPFSFISVFLNAALLVIPLTLFLLFKSIKNKAVVKKSRDAIVYAFKSTFFSVPVLFVISLIFKSDFLDSVFYFLLLSISLSLFSVVRAHVLVKEVSVDGLQEGDIPKRTIYLKKGKIRYWDPPSVRKMVEMAKKMDFPPFFGPKDADVVLADCLSAAGLTDKNIKGLKRRNVKSILVKVSLPFIPLLVLGYLLSLVGWSSVCVLVKQV